MPYLKLSFIYLDRYSVTRVGCSCSMMHFVTVFPVFDYLVSRKVAIIVSCFSGLDFSNVGDEAIPVCSRRCNYCWPDQVVKFVAFDYLVEVGHSWIL